MQPASQEQHLAEEPFAKRRLSQRQGDLGVAKSVFSRLTGVDNASDQATSVTSATDERPRRPTLASTVRARQTTTPRAEVQHAWLARKVAMSAYIGCRAGGPDAYDSTLCSLPRSARSLSSLRARRRRES